APHWSNGNVEEGAFHVFHGALGGFPSTPDETWESDIDGAHLGTSVAMAGDVTMDGTTDVIAGAPDVTVDVGEEGTAYLYLGGPFGLSFGASFEGFIVGEHFGATVAGIGDVNGDVWADVAIGAPDGDQVAGP